MTTKRLTCVLIALLLLLAVSANAQQTKDIHKEFRGIPWGSPCDTTFSGKEWRRDDGVSPAIDPKMRFIYFKYGPEDAKASPFVVYKKTNDDLNPYGFNVKRLYYGCHKDSGKFALVLMEMSALIDKNELLRKLTEFLGPPTTQDMARTFWDIGPVRAQWDGSILGILHRPSAGLE